MNRINKLFKDKKSQILSIYFTAGFPGQEDTLRIAQYVEAAGADMIEIGIPFSDPIADGPTIQESNKQALENGMNLKLLFSQLKTLREQVTIPVILMGYINPVLQFGFEKFCETSATCGVDGLILPDLPVDVYEEEHKHICEKYNLKHVFLISPQTNSERIQQIDRLSNSFIYMVSSASTTGAKKSFGQEQEAYFRRIKEMNLDNPTLTGFGISNHETFMSACKFSSGAIIGSGFIKLLEKSNDHEKDIVSFIKKVKEG